MQAREKLKKKSKAKHFVDAVQQCEQFLLDPKVNKSELRVLIHSHLVQSFLLLQRYHSNVQPDAANPIVIKSEPTFHVKVENQTDQLEIHQQIPAVAPRQPSAVQSRRQLEHLKREKVQLISDLMSVRDDYDRVCEKLNDKETELDEIKQNHEKLIADKNSEIAKLQIECNKIKSKQKHGQILKRDYCLRPKAIE